MPALGILAGRAFARSAVGGAKAGAQREAFGPLAADAMGGGGQAEAFQVGQAERLAAGGGPARNMAEGVGAGVAKRSGVRRCADAEGIKQENKGA